MKKISGAHLWYIGPYAGDDIKGLSYEIDFENVDEIDRSWPRMVFEFFGGTSDF
jgi:hypothetical protein